ncbi:MAG: sigma-54-dependent Fis family transcriptional regulator [Acidobacteria bacterium]|nr:sigma-54-dependent Fis family transcriptional regulator [Acidobacteriota bacterium]
MNTRNDIEEISAGHFFVAQSPVMRKIRAQAELLARMNVPVLILGESGSGKEILARLIHKLSDRAESKFVKVNCATLSRDLLESELFGCEPGAFAGAGVNRPGKFELCDKGTLLLDEIVDLPASLQAKLLHVLEDKELFRVGGDASVPVDVRIVAATNMTVAQALLDRGLREDVYYRLSAFCLHLPPLRERKSEIPVLVAHFMAQLARHYGLNPRPLPPALLNTWQDYCWPGNLRELENAVKRYLVMGEDSVGIAEYASTTTPNTEPVSWSDMIPESPTSVDGEPADPASLKSLVRSLKGEAERSAIANTLEKTNWNRKAAAQLLGISYRGLLYKIRDYQLAPPTDYVPFAHRRQASKSETT